MFDLKLGFTCNNNCVHCVVTDKRSALDLSTKEVEKVILEDSRLDKLVFTGGEPTIRSDFLHLIKYAKEVGVKEIILQTNGRRFSDFEFANEASKYLDLVLIAIHSHNEVIHEMITQRTRSWEETIIGFKNLVKIGKTIVHTQTVLSKLNCDNLLKTYDFIQLISPDIHMNLTFPHPNGSALTNFKIAVPKYKSIKKEVHKCLNKYGNVIHTESIPLCYIHPYINKTNVSESRFFDDAEIVRGLDRGNVDASNTFFDKKGIIDDYKEAILSDFRKPDSCKLCIYNKNCFGVWKEYFDGYKNELDLYPVI